MNTWILLLLLLGCCDGCGSQRNGSCGNTGNDCPDRNCGCGNERERDCDCGNGRDRDCDRGNDRDCDCDRGRDRDCDGNNSRFEPRFDARPFGGGDNCGCDA